MATVSIAYCVFKNKIKKSISLKLTCLSEKVFVVYEK